MSTLLPRGSRTVTVAPFWDTPLLDFSIFLPIKQTECRTTVRSCVALSDVRTILSSTLLDHDMLIRRPSRSRPPDREPVGHERGSAGKTTTCVASRNLWSYVNSWSFISRIILTLSSNPSSGIAYLQQQQGHHRWRPSTQRHFSERNSEERHDTTDLKYRRMPAIHAQEITCRHAGIHKSSAFLVLSSNLRTVEIAPDHEPVKEICNTCQSWANTRGKEQTEARR